MKLPTEVSREGWLVISESEASGIRAMVLRNAKLDEMSAPGALSRLAIALFRDGWELKHHGRQPPFWSAYLEKRVSP